MLTADNETAKEISSALGKYTISSSRVSSSGKLEQYGCNFSYDKSFIGRELMMPDELKKLKFGEAIFMTTRKQPIKAKIMPIREYPIKFQMTNVPNVQKEVAIKCFDLDEFRKAKSINKLELE